MTHKRSALAGVVTLVLVLAACSSSSASPSASTGASSSAAASAAAGPPGADKTTITDWTDPRPAEWTDKYPALGPITTTGDGSLKRVQDAGKIKVCSLLSLLPWNYIDASSGEVVGMEVDFLKYISPKLGIGEAEYVNVDFPALIPALQAGQCDVIMSSLGIRADRALQVKYAVPYVLTYDQFIVAGDSSYQTSDDMVGKRIGTFAGTADEDVLQAWVADKGAGSEILTFNTPNECFLATQNGTIDACFTDNVAIATAISGEYSSLRALAEPFDYAAGYPDDAKGDPYRLLSIATAMRIGDSDLNLAFSIVITQMLEDGTVKTSMEKWGLWSESQGELPELIRPDA